MDRERWGLRIKAFRKLKGYTQIEFSDEIGFSLSAVGEIERGKRAPSEEFLNKTLELLDISLDELQPPKGNLD